jgi:tetratricopeptide (TPR) repeat protein
MNLLLFPRIQLIATAALLITACSSYKPDKPRDFNTAKEMNPKVLARTAVVYVKLGEKDKGEQILNQALENAKAIKASNEQYSFKQDSALSEVAIGYGSIGQYNQAIEITDLIKDSIDRNQALAQVAALAVEVGQYDKAIQVAKKMGNSRSAVLSPIVTMPRISKPDIIAQVAVKYAEASQYDKALQAIQLVEDENLRVKTLSEVALEYAEAGQKNKAKQILEQALQKVKAIEETSKLSKANALAEIATKYAKLGEKQKAEQIFDQAIHYSDKFDAITIIGMALKYSEVGQKEKAKQLIDQALDFAKKQSHNKAVDLTEVAIKYAQVGYYDQAFQVVNTLEEWYGSDSLTGSTIGNKALVEIASEYAEAGQYNQALQVAENISNKDNGSGSSRSVALIKIALEYLQARRYNKALKIVKSVDSDSTPGVVIDVSRAYALAQIAKSAVQAEPVAQAEQVLDRALRVANTIEWDEYKLEALLAIATQYAQIEQKDKALQVLDYQRTNKQLSKLE